MPWRGAEPVAHDPHTGFILAAYGIAAIVIGTMLVTIMADHRALKRKLMRFGRRGSERDER